MEVSNLTPQSLREIAERFGLLDLRPVVERRGGAVLRAQQQRRHVFVKLSTEVAPFDREVEVLKALQKATLLTPRLLHAGECCGWFVRVIGTMPGRTLDDALRGADIRATTLLAESSGRVLGKYHGVLSEADLLKLTFWHRVSADADSLPSWRSYLGSLVSKWVSRIRFTDADLTAQYDVAVSMMERLSSQVPEPTRKVLLHCDYVGRNIMVDGSSRAIGLIDFETVEIGDPLYDAAKFVWATLDWDDGELRARFLNEWSVSYGRGFDWNLFHVYVGVQAMAAIAWCDKNPSDAMSNASFRRRATRTLGSVAREIQ
jgi:aminoglycoside phosphotransferase (APT) family kinase protein